jgi:hypothetical protein
MYVVVLKSSRLEANTAVLWQVCWSMLDLYTKQGYTVAVRQMVMMGSQRWEQCKDDFRLGKLFTLGSGLTSNSSSDWGSLISIAMGYGLDSWGSIRSRARDICLLTDSRPALGPSQLGVKQQGPEADHSPPSSAKVLDGGAMPPLPHLSTWCGA